MFARSGRTKLYFESTGTGVPVLLVMGLGMPSSGWWRTVPVLAERLRVITFDNRGTGASGRPRGPYTLEQMAADAVAVLDAAEAERAHVYGMSMGGMIAQEIALRHPDRVLRLVLGATTAGGASAVAPDEETLDFLRRRPAMPAEEGVWASIPYNYAERTRREHAVRIGEDVRRRLRHRLDPAGYAAQLAAAVAHDAHGRLHDVTAPTLVLHGAEDRLVPIGNGRALAAAIPRAHLEPLDDAAHLYTTDEPRADRMVLRFLSGARRPARARAGRA